MENKFEVIDFLRVILIIFVVTLHAYTTTGSVEWLNNGYPVYKFVTYNFALLAGYIAVPFFFFTPERERKSWTPTRESAAFLMAATSDSEMISGIFAV